MASHYSADSETSCVHLGVRPYSGLVFVGGAVAALIGLATLAGWPLGLTPLASLATHRIPMSGSTALLFCLYGIALVLCSRMPPNRRALRTSAILVASGTVLTLTFSLLSGLDMREMAVRWGFSAVDTVPGTRIGLISPVTAICFSLASLSYFASLSSRTGRSWRSAAALLFATVLLVTSFVFMLAYLYGGPLLYGGEMVPPALMTVLAHMVLGFALWGLAGPPAWLRDEYAQPAARASYALLLAFVVVGIGIITIGAVRYQRIEHVYRDRAERELSSIAALKLDELVQWRNERLGDGAVLFKNEAFTQLVRRCMNAPDDPESRERLSTWLERVRTAYSYDRLFLLDRQGAVRMCIPEGPAPTGSIGETEAATILQSGRVDLRDFYRDNSDGGLYLSVLVPLFDEQDDNKALGILVLRIDPLKQLYRFMSHWPASGQTGRTMIVHRDGNGAVFLDELRIEDSSPLMLRGTLNGTNTPAARAAPEREGILEGPDHRGVPMLAAMRAVPGSPWFLVARMDMAEVYAPLRARLWQMVFVVCALLFGAGVGSVFIWRQQVIRVYQERHRVHEALRRSERNLKAILSAVTESIFLIDLDGNVLAANEEICRRLGTDLETLTKSNIFAYLPPEVAESRRRQFDTVRESGEPLRFEDERLGRTYLNSLYQVRDANGQVTSLAFFSIDITDRKRAERALRDSEELFRSMAEQLLDVLFRTDENGVLTYLSPSVERVLGWTPEEMQERHFAQFLANEDAPRALEAFQTALSSDAPMRNLELLLKRKDGSLFAGEVNGRRVMAGERVAGVLGLIRDFTERKRAEEESNRLASVVRHSRELVALADRDGTMVFLNEAGRRMLGISEEAVARTEILCLIPEHLHTKALNEVFRAVIDNGYWTGDLKYVNIKTGVVSDMHTTAFRIDDPSTGALQYFANVSLDVTESKRAEAALQKSERRYRLLAENLNEVIWTATIEGRFTYVSPSVLHLRGFTPEEAMQQSFEETVCPGSRPGLLEALRLAVESAQSGAEYEARYFEVEQPCKDGTTVWTEVAARLIFDEEEQTLVVLGISHDITERKRAEETREKLEAQLRQSQKMEAVGQLAGGVAHDFNNLLQVILGYVDLVQGGMEPDSPKSWSLGEVRKAAERAADLTQQLLAFGRRQVIQPVDLDLNELVEGVLKMVRRLIGEHIELRFMPCGGIGALHADKGQIEQVVMNLCVNARDAMPGGGTLTIETERVSLDETYCRDHPWASQGRYALLSVTDTGCGMDGATLAQIFDPFFTTKGLGQGTGLGLATVYGTVKQHKGLLHVESELGRGTTFKVYLPIVKHAAEEAGPPVEVRVAGGNETILVAEDEELVRNLVSRILRVAGYTVLTACDGEDALRVFGEHADQIDMAVLDVMMPRMGGREVMERIQTRRQDMRFLFSSGYSEDAVHTDFVIKDGVHLIAKPYRKSDLLDAVRQILDGPRNC